MTVTLKLHELALPRASDAEQVTVVVPLGNVLPDAGVQVTGRAPSHASVAVGGMKLTAAVQSPGSVFATMLVGQPASAGPWLSLTVTVKLHESLPAAFIAVQVTVVVPFGKALPDAGEQVTDGVGHPVPPGVANVTTAVQSPGSVFVVMLVGQALITGGTRTVVTVGSAKPPTLGSSVNTVENPDPDTVP